MSRGRPKTESNEPKMDMTPIIDVVFNLLIFFMLTMSFVEEEGMLYAHLPKNEGTQPSNLPQNTIEEIRIRLLKSSGSENTRVLVGQQEVSDPVENPNALIGRLKNIIQIEKKAPVIIDATRKTEFKYLVAVLNSCKTAGVQEIKFAGKPIE